MKTIYILFLTALTGLVSANASTTLDNGIGAEDVWQVPHKPKGIKTRLDMSAVNSAGKDSGKKQETVEKAGDKVPGNVSKKEETAKRYVAVKTNMAYWAVAVANLSADVQLHGHVSLELPLDWSLWDIGQEHGLRLVLFQPEARWWTSGVGEGHFVGVHAHVGAFNVKWRDSRYQSAGRPLLGAGLTYGYSLPFSGHWGAEFLIGAGYANMKYDEFYNIRNGAKNSAGKRNYLGLTKLGVSLVYRF